MATDRTNSAERQDPRIKRARELAAYARNLEAVRKAKALRMRQEGMASCGRCIFWQAASRDWLRRNGRADSILNFYGLTGWCTGDPRHAPRQVKGHPTERQDYDLPCGRFLPYLDADFDPAA
ncbi:MAG: hypothetical protein AB7N69_09550 [Immundisolibacter sp.]|uniref:hypothetical protein n=1 Tax=Immundisolibacter sp. TaxID=1934948 RepID=UPI003D139EF0